MKLNYLLSSLILMLLLATGSHGQGASASVTTTFSNMEGVDGEKSSVVYSNRSGSPILTSSGFIAIGTFKLEQAQIAALATASDLNNAFYQFGESSSFNSTENGAFQANASGDPAEAYDEGNTFDGSAVYLVIGDGSDLATSSEFLVWKSDQVFDGSGPIGGPSELILSVDSGDLIIGLNDKNTSDFSAVGGDEARAAFTTVAIDSGIDDHGDSTSTATFVGANSTTIGNLKDGDDADYFRVDLSEDGNLSLSVAGGSNIVLSIYDDQGGELVSSSSPDQSVASDLASGTYYVRVAGDEDTSDVDYSLESDFEVKIIDLDPASAGSYYGLVRAQGRAFVGHLEITISEDGYYTGVLKLLSGAQRSIKGAIQPDYWASTPVNAYGQKSTLSFQSEQAVSGYYRLAGSIQPIINNGKYQSFELFKAIYGSAKKSPVRFRGRYTMLAPFPTTSDLGLPAGDSFASASLNALGTFNLAGYSSSGSKLTYSGALLETNKVSLYSRPENLLECLLGDLRFRDKETSDFSGNIRYSRKPSSGSYYSQNFAKILKAEGSKYVSPSIDELPLTDYILGDDNANSIFVGGSFGGVSYPITWSADGLMKTTRTPVYRASARFNTVNGRFGGNYFVSASDPDLADIRTYLRGVVLQKKGVVSGQAETVDNGVGRFSIVPAE
jgi:hypothetical protein